MRDKPRMIKSKNRGSRRIVRTVRDLSHGHWIRRQIRDVNASLRAYAEDGAASMIYRAVFAAIEKSGVSRAEMARALGVTRPRVSQILRGENITLKTLGALLWSCGQQVAELRTESVAKDDAS